MNITTLLSKLSTTRMENESLSRSVQKRFVVPFKIDQLDLRSHSTSIALVGSRGSGKSTFIQYFTHSTRFDCDLREVNASEFDCIVLYWKPDIAYCQGLNKSWLGQENAELFFMNHASIEIILEFYKMVTNVRHHFPEELSKLSSKDSYTLKALKNVTGDSIVTFDDIATWVDDQRFDMSRRLNPINTNDMLSLDPKSTLSYLISNLERDCALFKNTHFKVFIDEFELLNENQQQIINSFRKESKAKLSWNVAYKLHAEISPETTSNQILQEPDDYSKANLDSLIKENFDLYAAEIFLLSISTAGIDCTSSGINPALLGSRERISERQTSEYKETVLSSVKKLLPTPSIKDLSKKLFNNDSWLKRKVTEVIEREGCDLSVVDQIMQEPSIAVTIIGTSHQRNFDIDMFLKKTPSAVEKISSYEFNSLLTFRNQNSLLTLPLYAGFDRFIAMTTPNVRHFKVLCFNSLKQLDEESKNRGITKFEEIPPIADVEMDNAAVATSKLLVDEIISYSPHGNRLYMLVNRIGELFKSSQKSSYQTEPERAIFAIKYDYAKSEPDLEELLSAAEAWKILISDDSKRLKSDSQFTLKEYMLNPVFSPKFGITYRKKRGIIFDLDEFKILVNGTSEDFDRIRNEYRRRWRCDVDSDVQGENSQMKDQGSLL